jgi:hypothetical protein
MRFGIPSGKMFSRSTALSSAIALSLAIWLPAAALIDWGQQQIEVLT